MHQDNAPAQTSNFTKELFKRLGIKTLPHPPFSPDLAKCDFWLFPNLENHIRGTKFDNRKELMDTVIGYCNMVSKNGLEFVFRKWTERWDKCIKMRGFTLKKKMSIWMISLVVNFILN